MAVTVEDHYNTRQLWDHIARAIRQAGKDPSALEPKDLAAMDQLHTGGFKATVNLVAQSGLAPGSRVLDAGCGIGGSARVLGEKFNCRVSGIDLADEFINAARQLTSGCGLDDRIGFHQGSILDLPFTDRSFDAVLSQHVLMNIRDKTAVIQEFERVLKPGGRLLIHEIVQAGPGPVVYPVPWASHDGISFLEAWDTLRERLVRAGFTDQSIQDATDQARIWWQKVRSAHSTRQGPPPPLGPHLIFKENGAKFGTTMCRNLENNCIGVIEAVFTLENTPA